jgi:hypothetical protein
MENIQTEICIMLRETKVIIIAAENQWNDTYIMMREGETYHFESSGSWKDWSIICDADGYISKSILLRLTEWLRRLPKSNWLTLIGSTSHSKNNFFEIGHKATITIEQEGLFSCFANDVIFMYGNNSGEIELTIKRLV